jgi:hypothetical protein
MRRTLAWIGFTELALLRALAQQPTQFGSYAWAQNKRVVGVLGKRLARYGLTLHPDKTRFIDFRSYRSDGKDHPEADGSSFTFLGFCHVFQLGQKRTPTSSRAGSASCTRWSRAHKRFQLPSRRVAFSLTINTWRPRRAAASKVADFLRKFGTPVEIRMHDLCAANTSFIGSATMPVLLFLTGCGAGESRPPVVSRRV